MWQVHCGICKIGLYREACHLILAIFYVTLQGDSGSGLACVNSRNQWSLAGVVSYGPVHCDSSSYYQAVEPHMEWIKEQIGEDFGDDPDPGMMAP